MKLEFPNVNGNDEVYMDCLRAICGYTSLKSMIDIGCNLAPHTPLLGFSERKYIDVLPRVLDHPEEQQFFEQADALTFKVNKIYDVSIASDVIEHFKREDGYPLLFKMRDISRKQILFTPLGEYLVDPVSTDPEGHHSGWTPKDFPGYAFIVFPHYHPTLNIGAFFFWEFNEGIEQDFERVKQILLNKPWAK